MGSNYFGSVYQEYIYKSRYARYLDSEQRRENWPETIDRYLSFFQEHIKERCGYDISDIRPELEEAILNQEVMPSMRGLMTAGPALKRDEGAIYNCAYLPIDSLRSFDEELYTLMLGTGVGFSVESIDVSNLPLIANEFHESETTIIIRDSKLGWAKAFRELISLLVAGTIPKIDSSKVRPAGSRLKTFGGRASGPEPLLELFDFTIRLFKGAAGRRLTTLEAHDLACMVANIVVVGGVRRAALISLSDLADDRMAHAKSGEWWKNDAHRRLANNSAVYEEKPTISKFLAEWKALYDSNSGERGIFSRDAARRIIEHSNNFRRANFGVTVRIRDIAHRFGCNPCSEIILRPYEFCNLSEAIVRETDTLETLKRKVRLATIIGTLQSTLTKFRYINKDWQKNVEEERLLGVSLTGIFDNILTNGKLGKDTLREALRELRKVAIATNIEWAGKLGIPVAAAITCIKPSGTVSALNGTASGIHARHSPFYIRHVRNDLKDPLTQFLKDQGVLWEDDVYDPKNMVTFKFPTKAPEDAVFRTELSAIDHLDIWLIYQQEWAEHKPSVTISVRESEWMDVAAWVYENFDWMSGISFLPMSDHVYKQAPYEDITKEEYERLNAQMPISIDWSKLASYEKEDATTGVQELACVAGGCEV